MKVNRALLVAVGLLIFAGVAFVLQQSLRGMTRNDAAVTATDEPESPGPQSWADFSVATGSALIERDLVHIEREGWGDPFYRPRPRVKAVSGPAPESPSLVLEGLATNSGGDAAAFALISGQVLRIGDRIGSFQLSAIEHERVLLLSPSSGQLELTMSGTEPSNADLETW